MTPSVCPILTIGTPPPAGHAVAAALAARPELPLHAVGDPAEAAAAAAGVQPGLVLAWGEDVAAVRRALASLHPAPLLLALDVPDAATAAAAIEAGATDALRVDATPAEAAARLDLLLGLAEAQRARAVRDGSDPLTGALDRRAFLGRLVEEVERARRYNHTLSLLVVDVDGLKSINATHGIGTGDTVLRAVAAGCVDVLRETDLLGRLGDDEMGVLLPSTDGGGALALAERLRAALARRPLTDGAGGLAVTVCIGGAEAGDDSVEVLLGRAQTALQAAQAQGPDHVMLAIGGG